MAVDLAERVAGLPAEPGVYLFKNERGGILYIGKAQNLRTRVRSYLRGGDGRFRVPHLLDRARDVDVVLTANVKDALLLENVALRQQLAVALQSGPRPRFGTADRIFWVLGRRAA